MLWNLSDPISNWRPISQQKPCEGCPSLLGAETWASGWRARRRRRDNFQLKWEARRCSPLCISVPARFHWLPRPDYRATIRGPDGGGSLKPFPAPANTHTGDITCVCAGLCYTQTSSAEFFLAESSPRLESSTLSADIGRLLLCAAFEI